MNIIKLSIAQLRSRPFNSALSIGMFALGMGIISLLLHFEKYTENQVTGNLAGIDLVAGAKGSPLQLIMSSVLHIDNPTGNISLAEADKISKNPMVKATIPIALGDNYKGFRIVGTSKDYVTLYHGQLKSGQWNKHVMEVLIGSSVAENTGLKTGNEFTGVHGFMTEGHRHDDHKYIVAGILSHTGKVIDRLIITDVESVWQVHNTEDDHHHDCDHDHDHEHDHEHEHEHEHSEIDQILHKVEHHEELSEHEMKLYDAYKRNISNDVKLEGKEITSLLIFYRNPMAAATLARVINENTNLQAAAPLIQLNRLMSLLGYGFDALNILAWIIILFSGINIMIQLLNKLNLEIYDIALLRSLGVSRIKVLLLLFWQSIILALLGWIAGMLLVRIIGFLLHLIADNMAISMQYGFITEEFTILAYALLVGLVSAILPVVKAYRTDIHFLLNKL